MGIGGAFRKSSRLRRLAALLGVAALLAQTLATLIPMPMFVAGMAEPALAAVAAEAPHCPLGSEGHAPKGAQHPHHQCPICVALHMAGTFLPPALPDSVIADGSAADRRTTTADAPHRPAEFARPQSRAPPAPIAI